MIIWSLHLFDLVSNPMRIQAIKGLTGVATSEKIAGYGARLVAARKLNGVSPAVRPTRESS